MIDRNISFGCGGIFAQEIRAFLYPLRIKPQIFGFLAGLGGKDVTIEVITGIVDYALQHRRPTEDYTWVGLLK